MSTFALTRMSECPDLDALKRVWESLSREQQRDPCIAEYKELYKRLLLEQKA